MERMIEVASRYQITQSETHLTVTDKHLGSDENLILFADLRNREALEAERIRRLLDVRTSLGEDRPEIERAILELLGFTKEPA